MGKGAGEWRAEAERREQAEKENDVSRRSKEDCRCATSEMGEGQGFPKVDLSPIIRTCAFWRKSKMKQLVLVMMIFASLIAVPQQSPVSSPLLDILLASG